jgi:hypothetical protein
MFLDLKEYLSKDLRMPHIDDEEVGPEPDVEVVSAVAEEAEAQRSLRVETNREMSPVVKRPKTD